MRHACGMHAAAPRHACGCGLLHAPGACAAREGVALTLSREAALLHENAAVLAALAVHDLLDRCHDIHRFQLGEGAPGGRIGSGEGQGGGARQGASPCTAWLPPSRVLSRCRCHNLPDAPPPAAARSGHRHRQKPQQRSSVCCRGAAAMSSCGSTATAAASLAAGRLHPLLPALPARPPCCALTSAASSPAAG